jgi:hypothetical protein
MLRCEHREKKGHGEIIGTRREKREKTKKKSLRATNK